MIYIYIYEDPLWALVPLVVELNVVMDENKTRDRKCSGSPKEWEQVESAGNVQHIQKQRAPK